MYSTLITLILIGGFLFWYINIYNELQHYKTRITISENSIEENLEKKFNLICASNSELINITKNKDYLKEYIELKQKKISIYELDRKLIECISLIYDLKNDFEELNNKKFNKLLREIKKIDEQLSASKNFYNKYTFKINSYINRLSVKGIAKINGYKIKPFFEQKNMQDTLIDDFKI